MNMTTSPKDPIPKVSIGMPVYNGGRFIHRAITLLLEQTFTDFELIISDNASTDETSSICMKYVSMDKRVKYFRQTENMGAKNNFLFVCQKASGEYFMWAAADDEWDKDFIKILYKAITRDKNNVAAFCPYTFIDEGGQFVGNIRSFDYSGGLLKRLYKFIWYYDDIFFHSLFKIDIIKNIKFPTWWGINSNTYNNIAYQPLFYILSLGNFVFVGSSPLFFKRLHNYKQYQAGFYSKNIILRYYAFCLRAVNTLFVSIKSIYLGSGSALVTVACLPGLVIRCIYDCGPFVLKKLLIDATKRTCK